MQIFDPLDRGKGTDITSSCQVINYSKYKKILIQRNI